MFWTHPGIFGGTLPTDIYSYGQFVNPLRFDIPRVTPQAGFGIPTMTNVVDPSLLYGRLLHNPVANVTNLPFTTGIYGQHVLAGLNPFWRPII